MEDRLWVRDDHWGLVRFVDREEAGKALPPIKINRYDIRESPDKHSLVTKAIYRELVKKRIRYNPGEYHSSKIGQLIRTPDQILVSQREGNCLDLAVLFCGICLSYDLLPMIIVLEDHALAAVSLTYGLDEWNALEAERTLLLQGPLTDSSKLRELIESGSYLAVECTGFAHSEGLARIQRPPLPECLYRKNGVLSFERAVEAGKKQLSVSARPLRFALDIAVAQEDRGFKPRPREEVIVIERGNFPPLDEEAARDSYLKAVYKRCSSVTLPIDPRKKFSLQVIFQPLKLRRNPLLAEDLVREERRALQDESDYDGSPADDLLATLNKGQVIAWPGQATPTEIAKNGEDALNRSPQQRMVVLGGPGTGKTTLLRYLVSEYAGRAMNDANARLPLFVSLPGLALSGKTLKEYIMSTVQDDTVHIDPFLVN